MAPSDEEDDFFAPDEDEAEEYRKPRVRNLVVKATAIAAMPEHCSKRSRIVGFARVYANIRHKSRN